MSIDLNLKQWLLEAMESVYDERERWMFCQQDSKRHVILKEDKMAAVASRSRLVLSTETPEECWVVCLSSVVLCMFTMYVKTRIYSNMGTLPFVFL